MKKHFDADLHVRGESEFVDDVPAPFNLLHAQVFSSPVAHGTIRSLDLEAARASEGVVAVLTANEIPGENRLGPIIQDEELLVERVVRFVGHPIAIVVARTFEQARSGVRKIEATIEELEVITDPRVAFERGEIIGTGRTFEIGDVDGAWPECDVIVSGTCDLRGQEHLYLETNRARALPAEGGTVQVFSSTQSPYAAQKAIARILGIPENRVEVDVLRLGGGFGGKEDQATHWACMAAFAANRLKQPVEIVLHRMDDMRMTGKRHPYLSDFKLGLNEEGEILAFEVKHFQNAGAFADLSPPVLERTLFHSTNAYRVPNARIFAVSCRTHLAPNTAFRGFGGPQGMFAIEAALAKAAEATGRTRESLQYRNLIRDGDPFPYGQVAADANARRTWDEVASDHDLDSLRAEVDRFNRSNRAEKKGLAVMPICFGISFTKTHLNQASALVHVYTDGSVSVSNGGVEMGQGNSTKIRELAALSLGVGSERVRCESTNTRRIANMSPSAASATSDLNGFATLEATAQILSRLKSLAARHFELEDPDRVTVVRERVLLGGKDSGWSWSDLVLQAYLNRISLSAHGFHATPDIHFDRTTEKGSPFAYHTYGTAIVQVRLDCLRGIYEIEAIRIAHDLGRPLHEIVDLGQIEGGLAQGLGWMSMEDLQYDERGRYLASNLSTYKVPDVYFMPDELSVKLLEDADNPRGPLGSKAVGEPPLMYGIGLFFAVRDAMNAFRPDVDLPFDAPITPERVLLQLHSERLREIREQLESPGVQA